MILDSGINFSSFGWVVEVSKLLGLSLNSGGRWVRKNMPDFYELNCYKNKKMLF
jgi:hypothetical protein